MSRAPLIEGNTPKLSRPKLTNDNLSHEGQSDPNHLRSIPQILKDNDSKKQPEKGEEVIPKEGKIAFFSGLAALISSGIAVLYSSPLFLLVYLLLGILSVGTGLRATEKIDTHSQLKGKTLVNLGLIAALAPIAIAFVAAIAYLIAVAIIFILLAIIFSNR